nr:HAD-IA family hydrolase [Micromonospora sp. DSM 115978]
MTSGRPGAPPRPTALLIDLDGVLRHWDPEVNAGVERRYGLPDGSLLATAMRPDLVRPVLLGQRRHATWMAGVAAELADLAGGPEPARQAVAQWQEYRGEVDIEVLALVRELRAAGVPVGLATNATDLLDADLDALKLTGELDVVISSAALGVAKPAPEYFARACAAVATPPGRVLFVDDDDRAVSGARAAGLLAYRWTGRAALRYLRAALLP